MICAARAQPVSTRDTTWEVDLRPPARQAHRCGHTTSGSGSGFQPYRLLACRWSVCCHRCCQPKLILRSRPWCWQHRPWAAVTHWPEPYRPRGCHQRSAREPARPGGLPGSFRSVRDRSLVLGRYSC